MRTTLWRYHLGAGCVPSVAGAVRDSGLPPDCLALEITESVLMHDLEVAIVRLHELKGARGPPGHRRLRHRLLVPGLPAADADRRGQDRQVARRRRRRQPRGVGGRQSHPALAATLHLDTLAEGVEQAEQAPALAGLGCHLAQGYHFSRPVPAADMARMTGRHPVASLPHPA